MTFELAFEPETLNRLRSDAEKSGKSIEQLVIEAVESRAATSEIRREIRVGYDELIAGEACDPDDVLAEIRVLSDSRRRLAGSAQ